MAHSFHDKLLALLALAAGVCFLFASGCSKRSSAGIDRLAIAPFENLGEDTSQDWMGSAAGEIVAADLEESARVYPIRLSFRREAPSVGATHLLHGYFSVAGGRLRVNVSVEHLGKNQIAQTFSAEGRLSDGILPLADSIARRIAADSKPFETRNSEALRAYVEAGSSSAPAVSAAAYARAVSADPDFGAAYAGWSRVLLSRGDRAGAERVIQMARRRGDRIRELQRVRLDLVAAELNEDRAAGNRALLSLSRLTPADVDVLRRLGRRETAAHRYPEAAGWYRKAAEHNPSNPLLWNELGYAEAFARNLEGARKALEEYERLVPEQANPSDSLGDVHFYLGRFAEAEKFYLQAHQKNPAFAGGATLYKAARTRLMTGDIRGADEIFRGFIEARLAAKDPLIDYREAQWKYLTGRRRQAVAQLEQFTASASRPRELVSQAYAQLSAWSLLRGDRERAGAHALQAAAAAGSAGARHLAAVCRFLAEPPPAASELAAKAQAAFPGADEEAVRRLALSYALLLGKHFSEASPVLRKLFEQTEPTSGDHINVLLAWALVEQGQIAEAAKLLEVYGIPQPGAEASFVYLTFPRVFELKSAVFEKQGRAAEASRNHELFLKLSGRPLPSSRS